MIATMNITNDEQFELFVDTCRKFSIDFSVSSRVIKATSFYPNCDKPCRYYSSQGKMYITNARFAELLEFAPEIVGFLVIDDVYLEDLERNVICVNDKEE